MNRTLISALDLINTLLALAIIGGCTAFGLFMKPAEGANILLGIAGLGAGTVLAAIICGLFALLLEVEDHLRRLVILREAELNRDNPNFGR
ncbi:hypothetical protein [Rhizobium sp. AAP43]|uniref:hypothetical protein n=1 Tax=Rhizobium sp. AAP43 TaxID=1523420 RepID=UPI0006B935F1|nr:hypothetical protein [Rhizobium sp. AAP43]KPF41099.1 hypothetical protein IP76_22275 [Rhizobium sp. AAP43]